MQIRRWLSLFGLLSLWAVCLSCGQNYRLPIIQIPGDPGDPKLYHFAITISTTDPITNPTIPGTVMQVDVVGDMDVGEALIGRGPIYATLLPTGSANRIYVANAREDTVTTTTAAPLSCSPGPVCPIGAVATITMPAGAAPSFLNSTEASNMYVILKNPSRLPPGPQTPTIGVIPVFSPALGSEIALPIGNPVAMVELPNGRKLYVLDQANSVVYVINTVSKQIVQTLAVGTSPTMALASADSSAVYVMTNSGVSVIDALTDIVIGGSLSTGGQPNFIAYDFQLRLYVTDTGGGLGVYDAAVAAGNLPNQLVLKPAGTFPGVLGVAPLPDGSRFYVLTNPSGTSLELTDVSKTFAVKSPSISLDTMNPNGTPVPPVLNTCSSVGVHRYMAGASADSGRVYVTSCDAGGTYIVRTSDDTGVLMLPSPGQPPFTSTPIIRQNPVFLITGR